MKKRRHSQFLLMIIAFLVTVCSLAFIESPGLSGAMAGSFLTVVGAYTALDLRSVVKRTGELPAGSYMIAEKWRYYVGIILMGLLFLLCIIKSQLSGMNYEAAYILLGPGILVLIGIVISGMKLNKVETLKGAPSEKGGEPETVDSSQSPGQPVP